LIFLSIYQSTIFGTSVRAADPAERRALPHPPGDELERPSADLLAGAGDTDDHRDTPAAMGAFERLTHEVDIAHTLEAIVGAAVGERNQVRDEIAADFLWIDEVRHAELLGERLPLRIDVDTDDLIGAHHVRALDDIKADAAQAKDDDIGARLDLGVLSTTPMPS